MMCPICGSKELKAMGEAEMGPDPYDYSKKGKDERIHEAEVQKAPPKSSDFESTPSKCPMCGFDLQSSWKFCPNCGVSFGLKK
jgi:rubrerythrin